ncbi:MAG: tryptophan--tRNA ligase [Erysipelotrichaceae bacterium]|nr:tryptophan--tRNA ligase [Erysipelotrichaceae bacterium]
MAKERILTGIKPTGQLTLGNYLGVLKHLPDVQERGESFIFIADLHALTMPIEPEMLRQNSIDIAAFYLAAGLDPKKTTLFLQSSVSAHAELNAIMQNYLYMGELSRMTQFKEKTQKLKSSAIGLGIFAYPVLMACDIILYNATIIPVGEDQVQHVELTRDLVNRFNNRYGEILAMPKAEIRKVGSRIMSLSDPSKKMSKSDPKGDVYLKDDLATVRKKIMSAVTDSGSEVTYDVVNKPGISNLLTIYAATKDITIEKAQELFKGYRYGDFKKAVADAVCEDLGKFQERYKNIIDNKIYEKVLKEGASRAREVANVTLNRVKKAVGLLNE